MFLNAECFDPENYIITNRAVSRVQKGRGTAAQAVQSAPVRLRSLPARGKHRYRRHAKGCLHPFFLCSMGAQDMYSFGCLLYSMLSGQLPWPVGTLCCARLACHDMPCIYHIPYMYTMVSHTVCSVTAHGLWLSTALRAHLT